MTPSADPDATSTGIPASFLGFPKPKKSDRPGIKRRKEIKKKDRELQLEVSGYGNCFNCKKWRYLYGDHRIKRRFLKTRHDRTNIRRCCSECNVDLESLPKEKLREKYPHSPLVPEWQ